jgi:hypothetical protein
MELHAPDWKRLYEQMVVERDEALARVAFLEHHSHLLEVGCRSFVSFRRACLFDFPPGSKPACGKCGWCVATRVLRLLDRSRA